MLAKVAQLFVATALVTAAMPATPALAGPLGLEGSFSQKRVAGYFNGSGGEFTLFGGTVPSNASYAAPAKDVPDPATTGKALPPSFQTFCLETGETAAALNYFVVGIAAVQGGTSTSDRISKGTAWLYSEFAKGTLKVTKPSPSSTGDYFSVGTPARSAEATSLQKAIWWLEGEDGFASRTPQTLMANPYFAAAVKFFGTQANAVGDAKPGQYGVYVLNNFLTEEARDLWVKERKFTKAARAQDFVYYRVPDGGTSVMLLGGALLGLAALRRRLGA